jgi:tripartite-type tricarboxylate transporter receptor subunit TctC
MKNVLRKLTIVLSFTAASSAYADNPSSSSQKGVEDFYRGNTVFMIVGSAPGGGFDFYARTIAKYLTKYIPGAPLVMPQNMPGGGGISAGSRVAVTAPQDGTFIGAIHPTTIVDPILGDPTKGTKALNFAYLGSASMNVEACFMRTDAAAKDFSELFSKEIVFGAANHSSSSREYVALLQNVMGMKIRLVSGYKGSNEIMLALERGEIGGTCGAGYQNVISSFPRWFKDDFVRVVAYQGSKEITDVPEMRFAKPTVSFAKTEEQRQILNLYDLQEEFGRPYVTGAGVPGDRIQALRKAFMEALNDANLRQEIEGRNLDVSPISGEELQRIVASIYEAPESILVKTRKALGYE